MSQSNVKMVVSRGDDQSSAAAAQVRRYVDEFLPLALDMARRHDIHAIRVMEAFLFAMGFVAEAQNMKGPAVDLLRGWADHLESGNPVVVDVAGTA